MTSSQTQDISTPEQVASPTVSPPENSDAIKQAKMEEAAIASLLQQIRQKSSEYHISSADLLEITVYREQELDRIVRVSQNGALSLPLIGNVKVGGLSLAEAESMVADKLKDFLVNPQVTIFIKEYGNKKIFVLGEVVKPGSFEFPPESHLTVLEAVSMAGGFTQVAARDRTKIIRTMPDGRSQSLMVEVSAITVRGEKHRDLPLEPNDVVYVPQSFF